MRFPTVTGSNLNRRQFTLPADFEGEINLAIIAFQRWQQLEVDTWIPLAERLAEHCPQLRFYELPTISQLGGLFQRVIDGGMRAGIPDKGVRDKTITLYLDKEAFRRALALPHENTIFVLLVDRQGQVLWRSEGPFVAEQGQSLEETVRRLCGPAA